LPVYGKELYSLEIALPNGGRRQLRASDVHARLGLSHRADNMGGGKN